MVNPKEIAVSHDIRDSRIDFVRYWSGKTEILASRFIFWIGILTIKFYDRKNRYGKVDEHNRLIPRDSWMEEWEKGATIDYYRLHRNEGYRRLTFMISNEDMVAISPSTVY